MDNLNIKKTESSPKVLLNADSGLIEFEGESYPEDTFGFYKPILEWLKEYFNNSDSKKDVIVNMKLHYFNSATTQVLFDILEIFDDYVEEFNIKINWYYDSNDEDGLMDFEDYSEEYPKLNINSIPF